MMQFKVDAHCGNGGRVLRMISPDGVKVVRSEMDIIQEEFIAAFSWRTTSSLTGNIRRCRLSMSV